MNTTAVMRIPLPQTEQSGRACRFLPPSIGSLPMRSLIALVGIGAVHGTGYRLPDGSHRVMLASRELSSKLPAEVQNWVNEVLQFTYGEGLAMNTVSNETSEGLAQCLVDNAPAESQHG